MLKGYNEITELNDEELTAVREATKHFRQRPALYGAAAKTYVGRLLNDYDGNGDFKVSVSELNRTPAVSLKVKGKVVKAIPVTGIYQSLNKAQLQAAINDVMAKL